MALYPGTYLVEFKVPPRIKHFATIDKEIDDYFRTHYYEIERKDASRIRRLLRAERQIERVRLHYYRVPLSIVITVLPPPPPSRKYYRNIGCYMVVFISPGTRLDSETGVFGLDIKGITETMEPCINEDLLLRVAEGLYNYSKRFWDMKLEESIASEDMEGKEINEGIDIDEVPDIDDYEAECNKPRFTIGFYDSKKPDAIIYYASGHYVGMKGSAMRFFVDESDSIYYTRRTDARYAKGTAWYDYFDRRRMIEVYV